MKIERELNSIKELAKTIDEVCRAIRRTTLTVKELSEKWTYIANQIGISLEESEWRKDDKGTKTIKKN